MAEPQQQGLLEFLQEHFTKIDQRFDGIDQRFARVDQRFDEIDQRFARVDQRFDGIDREFGVLRKEMKEEFARVDDRINTLAAHVDDFVQLHQKVDIELAALRALYDQLTARVARLEGQRA
ncbi:hypothetical protein HYV74_03925 [Candidatus Uhrbacteria bacterium]|nr:hypothetical protein [Candidatus Uhrbacteria bacterium]